MLSSRDSNFSTKYFVKSSRFCGFCINALWKLREFSLTPYCQNSRESNSFTIWITKELIWRNSSLVREKFPKCGIAHWCRQRITQCRNCDNLLHNFLPKLPWNQCIYYFILYSVFTNFFLEWNSEISTLYTGCSTSISPISNLCIFKNIWLRTKILAPVCCIWVYILCDKNCQNW